MDAVDTTFEVWATHVDGAEWKVAERSERDARRIAETENRLASGGWHYVVVKATTTRELV